MNSVNLVGNIVRDPELKYTQGGMAICKFTIAINRFTKKDEEEKADYIQILTFNKTAENVANFTAKGSKVAVTGSISTGSYKDKEDKTVYTFEVLANNVQFLTRKEGQEPQQPQQPVQQQPVLGQQPVQQQFNTAPQGYTQQQNFGHQAPQFAPQQQPQQQIINQDALPF